MPTRTDLRPEPWATPSPQEFVEPCSHVRLTILIADDHAVVRDGLRSILSRRQEFQVVSEAADGYRAIELARVCSPDVIIMDIEMPKLNGIEATRAITKHRPGSRIVMLSTHSDPQLVLAAFEAGAIGFVDKIAAAGDLVQAILLASRG